jgi:alpha-N-arabinofuranosidase
MDKVKPVVGEQSPRITLASSEARDIQQEGLKLGKGKSYTGRIYLAGTPGAKLIVRLVWGLGVSDSKAITIPALTPAYGKCPIVDLDLAFSITPTPTSTTQCMPPSTAVPCRL